MITNMGTIDRTARLVAVAVIATLYVTNQIAGTLAVVLGVIAALFLVTSAIGWCPTYAILGITTRRVAPHSTLKI